MNESKGGFERLFRPPVITEQGLEETLLMARLLTWPSDLADMPVCAEAIQ